MSAGRWLCAARLVAACCVVVVGMLLSAAGPAHAACAPGSTGKYPTAVKATSGLLGYWRLNETSGTQACDAHGTNHGTLSGGFLLNQGGALSDLDPSTAFDGARARPRATSSVASARRGGARQRAAPSRRESR
jgi:hypothetical protein